MTGVPLARELLRARDLADARYFEPLTVADLAAAASLSHQYLLTRRLERAAALLRTSDWSVSDICCAVGADSLGSFTTRFRRMFGVTPGAYRATFPPAESHVRIPRCVALAFGRPQNRTFREDPVTRAS
jgi:AraC-like DNA-binding protein